MTKPKGVRTEHPDYIRMAPLWQQCSDAAEGEYVIHAAGEKYLPKLKGEEKNAYAARKARTPFFNATWRTISGLKGMLFRKAPVPEATSAVIELLKDADMAGTTFEGLSQETAEELLTTGRHCLLVDFPPTNTEGLTQAAVAAMKLRPMILQYKAADLINWKSARVNNVVQLTLAVLRESADAATDEFSQDTKAQYRVLDLVSLDGTPTYRQRVFQVIDDKDVQIGGDIFPKMGSKTLDFIPFVILGVDHIGPRVESPPLLDLVAMNLHHYQVSADYEHGCHFTGLPTPVISGHTTGEGESAKPIYIGGDSVICLPDPNAKAAYLEVTTDFEALRKNLEDKKAQMAVLGARMLEAQKAGVEAAETLKRRTAGEQSQLAALAETMTLGLTKVLQIFSDWAGGSGEVKVQINKHAGGPYGSRTYGASGRMAVGWHVRSNPVLEPAARRSAASWYDVRGRAGADPVEAARATIRRMSDTPKIRVLLGGGMPKPVNAADALILRAEAELDDFKKYAAFDAKRKKAQYDAYIAAGFTAAEALQLVK